MIGRRADNRLLHKVCSLVLQYPDQELLQMREQIVAADVPQLRGFMAWWGGAAALELAEHYVRTFDMHKRTGMYLTFYAEGERRERGLALLRLRKLYRAAGLPMESGELPDFLPVMLEFAAAAPRGRGETLLREHRPALELLRAGLREEGTPYAEVVDAVCRSLGEPTALERATVGRLAAEGPPTELVGLEPFAPAEAMPPAMEARR